MNTQNTPVHIRLWHRDFWLMAIANLLLTVAVYALIPVMPRWLMQTENLTLQETGMIMGAFGVGIFLFGCFTGLRLSDIRGLEWGNISKRDGSLFLSIKMQKTREPLIMKLNKQAIKWMPEKQKDSGVFALPGNNVTVNRILKIWAKNAGIKKDICFHMSRHTFATMELTLGADLYVVSKLLGHTNVGTTQIYADIINKRRDEAVELIDNAF